MNSDNIKTLAKMVGEALKKPNATTRHLRDYPVSDKDMAKPVKKPEKKKPEQGVAEGEGKTQKYEMMMRNGQVKRFTAKDDADAKRIAAGHGAKSVIRLKGGVPAGKVSEQGVAEAAFKDPSPMMKDAIKQDKIRSLKNLIAIAKVKGVQHKVKEYESELKKLKEASVFPHGSKPPRKGSVAYNALMKRKEQDKKRVKEIEAIGTKNHHIGVAKVTREEIEVNESDMYSYIDQTKGPVLKGKTGTYVGYTHSTSKGKGANILKHNKTGKYYAAGGSSTAFTAKTTLHDTPEDAARAYHKGNLAEEASPMIKPPKNEFSKKEDAFAHAKQHGGKVMKKTSTHPSSGIQTVSYVVKEDLNQLDEITLGNYREKAENEVKELKPHAKGEYGDFAKKIIAKRKAGLQRAIKREDVNNEAYMGKVTTVSNPREKWMKSVKDRGYDMRAGAQRLQDLLDKQKKERAEMEQRAKEKGLEY